MAGGHHYCSYFDHRYLARGLAMIRSLRRFDTEAVFWVLCLSETCERALRRLQEPNVRPIAMTDFLAGDAALQAARAERSTVEFYFTCTPALVCYVLDRTGPDDVVTYVDGDLYFFDAPTPLFDALDGASVSIVAHRFPEAKRDLQRFGIYNVGWLGFRNDGNGRAAAQWWRTRCNEWCFDIVEDDRYADQKYLDRFGELFEGVVVLSQPGANLAPWNVARHRLALSGRRVLVDGEPLIFFHYQGLRELGRHLYFAAHHQYDAPLSGFMRRHIYRPYLARLSTIRDEVASLVGEDAAPPLWRGIAQGGGPFARAKARLQPLKRYLNLLLKGQVIVVRARDAETDRGNG